MQTAGIDEALRRAVDNGDVPGVVAGVTAESGTIYEGAFGRRDLSSTAPMTMDAIVAFASMTKPVTAAAAMQLVEAGKLGLDEPVGEIVPQLAAPLLLEGFGADGTPRLRPARRSITLRRLLTHSSGIVHEFWSAELRRYQAATGLPDLSSRTLASLCVPLLFEPGERWAYGVNLEWVGRMIEAVSGKTLGGYLRDHLTGPLGMKDTLFGPAPAHAGRLAVVHQREPDGSLRPTDFRISPGEYESGGGGLYGTVGDYLIFLRMLLNRGRHEGMRLLGSATVDLMHGDHLGHLLVRKMTTAMPMLSRDFEPLPGMAKKWSLSALLNTEPVPGGRSAHSLGWGGLANTYFWLDPTKRIAGVFATQILPFADPGALAAFATLERSVYSALNLPRGG